MSLLEQLQRKQQDATAANHARYVELLSRNGNPEPGDADELLSLMLALGKSASDAESDAAVLAEDRNYAGADDALEAVAAKHRETTEAEQTVNVEVNKTIFDANERRNAARLATLASDGAVSRAADRVERRKKLRAANFRLFNLPDPSAPRPVASKSDAQLRAESRAGGVGFAPEYRGLSWPQLVAIVMAEDEAAKFVATDHGNGEPGEVLAHLKRYRGILSPKNVAGEGVDDGTFHTTDDILARAAAKHEPKPSTKRGDNGRFVSFVTAAE